MSCGTADCAAGPMLARASHAAHRTPGMGSPRASARTLSHWPRSDRWTPRLRRVDADVWILVRKGVDERADRRAGTRAQRAQGACGIARDRPILVSQRPPQRRLNRFYMRHQVNQFTDGALPDGGPLMPQQVHQQRNGRRIDSLDDVKRHNIQVFLLGVEESSQQRNERCPTWTRAASAVARTFGSLAKRRFAQSRSRAGSLERLDSVGGSGDWDSATA